MHRTKLVAALVLVGAVIAAVLLGGTASAQTPSAAVDVASNRAW